MAWKLALSGKQVALNTLMAAAFLLLVAELLRTNAGQIVLGFFIFPAVLIGMIDLVFIVLRLLWNAIFRRKTQAAA